ncbi:DgyrCDS1669 [Dimorphilus gyrociliatus]|uniref:DgyrCDS1669 n=1 Tax=Dimorphilus gyrociliatus TaxID=2664684 RepID=A0A7I8V7X4_9ANNE|nr:DgyrCDS1669 [Dimorphilus gyrociliatus]
MISKLNNLMVSLSLSDSIQFVERHPFLSIIGALTGVWTIKQLKKPRNLPPGPISLPFIGGTWALYLYGNLQKLRQKYGDVFSMYIGSELVIYIFSKDLIKEVYVDRRSDFSAGNTNLFDLTNKSLVNSSNTDRWKKIKLLILPLFNCYIAHNLEKTVNWTMEGVCRKLTENNNVLNPDKLIRQALTQIALSLYLNERRNLDDFELNLLQDTISQAFSAFSNFVFNPFINFVPFPNVVFRKSFIRPIELGRKLRQFFQNRLIKRQKYHNQTKPGDFLHALMILFDNATDGQVIDIFIILIIDSIHTISIGILWTILRLALNQKLQYEIHELIDRATGNRCPNLTDRAKLALIEAAFLEALRLDDLLMASVYHRSIKNTELKGYFIPKDTAVKAVVESVHLDEQVYSDPYSYKPHRFLSDNGLLIRSDEFLSFGLGSRRCIGEQMVRIEAFLILSTLLFSFKMEFDGSEPSIERQNNSAIPTPHPFKIKFTPRR